jgi:electron transport complex protein RnfB
MITALVTIIVLAALAGAASVATAGVPKATSLVDRIDALLPQTQCRRCTFDGCRPYAEAIAQGAADINQCPPGGERTAQELARLMGVAPKPVGKEFGVVPEHPAVAFIEEDACIGCTKCIQACPVDAIVGASRYMHTVIAADCTGCELCIPPCPVDCIIMQPASAVVR